MLVRIFEAGEFRDEIELSPLPGIRLIENFVV